MNALREELGKAVRKAYIARCKLKPHPKPDVPWEEMSEFDRETDRVIADAVVVELIAHILPEVR